MAHTQLLINLTYATRVKLFLCENGVKHYHFVHQCTVMYACQFIFIDVDGANIGYRLLDFPIMIKCI